MHMSARSVSSLWRSGSVHPAQQSCVAASSDHGCVGSAFDAALNVASMTHRVCILYIDVWGGNLGGKSNNVNNQL